MTKHETYLDDDTDSDELRRLVETGQLPRNAIVTAEQLRMKPGQKLSEKAKELGVTTVTLRLYHTEWKGSGYDPEYVIKRGHLNYKIRNRWSDRDWTSAVTEEISRGRARHVGDVCLEVGITGSNAQLWPQRSTALERVLYHSGVPCPKHHWKEFLGYVRHGTIDRYRELKAEKISAGMSEIEAAHTAADEAVNELKHKTRQRRRVERDVLMGVGGHEELLRRYRKGSRLSDAHSKRIARKLLQVSRAATMERALRETGHDEDDIREKMDELLGAFKRSNEEGQARWKKTHEAVLRRRSEADAMAHAVEVEAHTVKEYAEQRRRTSPLVTEWAAQRYGEGDAVEPTAATKRRRKSAVPCPTDRAGQRSVPPAE